MGISSLTYPEGRIYLFHCDLEVQFPNRLGGGVREDSLNVDLSRHTWHATSDKVDAELRVEHEHLVRGRQDIARW